MEQEIIKLYTESRFTLRMIAEKFNTNHHKIKRILIKNGITITRRNTLKKFSDEHRKKISESSKGRPCYWKNKKMPLITNYKNMLSHLKYDIDLEWLMQFKDIEKLKLLNKSLTRGRDCIGVNTEIYKSFIEKFYNDIQFNKIYETWINNDKEKYLKPSLDHINPKCKGGKIDDINNLQFLSWFENRCKNDMSIEDWITFKTNITKYFI